MPWIRVTDDTEKDTPAKNAARAMPSLPSASSSTALGKLASSLGVPSLRDALLERGVDERAFRDAVPGMARDALASGSPANNPLVPSEADVARLYHACYDND